MALFVSYIGRGYNGMQRNPGVKSIEGDLIVALWKAGAITEECRDRLDKVDGVSWNGLCLGCLSVCLSGLSVCLSVNTYIFIYQHYSTATI